MSRIFQPQKFYLVVWILTLTLALFGVVASQPLSLIFWIWMVIAATALRQIWTIRWVQVDKEGIRVRNIAHRGREMRWDAISKIEEREIPIRKKKSFRIVKVTGEMTSRPGRVSTITIDSDTVDFDTLIEIIRDEMKSDDKMKKESEIEEGRSEAVE